MAIPDDGKDLLPVVPPISVGHLAVMVPPCRENIVVILNDGGVLSGLGLGFGLQVLYLASQTLPVTFYDAS